MSKVIAIIDDEQEMQFLYELMLEDSIKNHSIELEFFSDAREFSKWFKDHHPDLIMTDLNMPFMTGTEISKFIRQSDSEIPIYIVSGYEESDYANIMRELKINRFLEKPLDYDSLANLIEHDLGIDGNGANPQ
jgi:two-component system, response regulator YesN